MTKHVGEGKLMKVSEASRYLGLHRNFIQSLLNNGELLCIRLDGYKIRIARDDLDRWVDRNRKRYEAAESRSPAFRKKAKAPKE